MDWLSFTIALVALVMVIIIYIVYFFQRSHLFARGIALQVQQGKTSGNSDQMVTGGNNLYIMRSNSDLTLTITSDNNNITGRQLYIKNNTAFITTLDTSQLSSYSPDTPQARTIPAGGYIEFVFTDLNKLLRLTPA